MSNRTVEIAVSVVRNADGHVLMARRTARQLSPGCWELPGGKLEAGETPERAAWRELAEETGVEARALRPLMRYAHDFPTRRVWLNVFEATAWRGEPHGREGQSVAWIDPAALPPAPILPSVARVLTSLGLPEAVGIVEMTAPDALASAESALAEGVKLLQLRGERLAPEQKVSLARRIGAMARARGARVLLAGGVSEAARAGLDGVHSDAAALAATRSRPPLPLWSVQVRDAADASRAAALGADFALAEPRARAANAPLPVYALTQPGRACRAAATI